jgi:hypothetical protein
MAAVRAAKHRGRVSLKLKAYALIVSDGMRFKKFLAFFALLQTPSSKQMLLLLLITQCLMAFLPGLLLFDIQQRNKVASGASNRI